LHALDDEFHALDGLAHHHGTCWACWLASVAACAWLWMEATNSSMVEELQMTDWLICSVFWMTESTETVSSVRAAVLSLTRDAMVSALSDMPRAELAMS
tara:strand:+ start:899 stop:1195 length:297 start_codon:yes stop_codon:yes gene_type:complete